MIYILIFVIVTIIIIYYIQNSKWFTKK
jgi:hypothetical protein